MTAEAMFLPLNAVKTAIKPSAIFGADPLIVDVAVHDVDGQMQARAYPLQMIGYHHQLRDNLAGTAIMVTYCTVDGKLEQFRLVGMNRFNAQASWADKSWVIGLKINGQAHAFDWNALEKGAVRHTIGGVPVVGALAPDGLSFYFVDARDAKTHQELALSLSADGREWIDAKSGHRWALSGAALRMENGEEHEALHLLPSSQEFWHSWQTFQPGTNGP
jgi:hypothetical protein